MIFSVGRQQTDKGRARSPSPFVRQPDRKHLPELDGLRCLAIVIVMVWHASLRAARYYDGVASPRDDTLYGWFPHGELGVLLFFVISGFIVSLPFLRRSPSADAVANFYKRRFVRIYPPYMIALSIALVALGIVGHVPKDANSYQSSGISLTQSFLASTVYLHGLIFDAPSRLNPPMWSLEIEIAFYALLPMLMVIYCRIPGKAMRCAILLAVIAGTIAMNALTAEPSGGGRFRVGLVQYGYYFLVGILLAESVGQSLQAPQRRYRYDVAFVASCGLLFLAGLVLTASDASLPAGMGSMALHFGIVALLFVVFVTAFWGKLTSRVLSRPWIGFLGVSCYSLYLTHVPVMQAVSELLPRVVSLHDRFAIWSVWLAVMIPVAICSGTLFYLAVERPFSIAASAVGRARTSPRARPKSEGCLNAQA